MAALSIDALVSASTQLNLEAALLHLTSWAPEYRTAHRTDTQPSHTILPSVFFKIDTATIRVYFDVAVTILRELGNHHHRRLTTVSVGEVFAVAALEWSMRTILVTSLLLTSDMSLINCGMNHRTIQLSYRADLHNSLQVKRPTLLT